eukprot:4069511-Prymnesium_polylepis.1
MSRTLRYDPKQSAGTAKSKPKVDINSRALIQFANSSRPAGATTSKTLGMAATHWTARGGTRMSSHSRMMAEQGLWKW